MKLLTELTLGSVTPYATQFVWRDVYRDGGGPWDSGFTASEPGLPPQPISMQMNHYVKSALSDSGVYEFAYFVRTADDGGWTVRGDRGSARGSVNYLRLIKTIGLALRAFVDTVPNVDAIDITGSDEGMGERAAQKSAIYARLLTDNPVMSEFAVKAFGDKLYLVRTAPVHYDATGIKDTPAEVDDERPAIALTRAQRDRIANP